MLKTDLINILSDAIQTHEGWSAETGASYPNRNPGNLKYVGQEGATAGAQNFCVFDNFQDGKQALNNDIGAKMTRLNTIRDIITEYAPQSQNDTEAYIASVCAFLLSRNVVLNPDSPIDAFLSQCQTPVVIMVANDIWEPADWAIFQAGIVELAKFMPLYAFSTRYSSVNLTPDIVTAESAMPTPQNVQMISADAVKTTIAPYNNGQTLNLLVYQATIMDGQPNPCGGCEYLNVVVSAEAPFSAVGSVADRGQQDILARDMFHELIHELFNLTKGNDTLHEYLIAHGGYLNNLAVDLSEVFTGNSLNTPSAVATLVADRNSLEK